MTYPPNHSLFQRGHATLIGWPGSHAPLELDVEASLPQLLAGEGEMGEGVQHPPQQQQKKNRLFCH